ncbi:MAG: magnesium chelatase, partial [Sphingomonadales bacterium]
PRAAVMVGVAARAQAALEGRDYTIPDDVKLLAAPLLRHRVALSAAAAIEGKPVDAVVRQLIDEVAAPR